MAERRKPDADGNTGDVTAKPFVRLVRDQEREFYPICMLCRDVYITKCRRRRNVRFQTFEEIKFLFRREEKNWFETKKSSAQQNWWDSKSPI